MEKATFLKAVAGCVFFPTLIAIAIFSSSLELAFSGALIASASATLGCTALIAFFDAITEDESEEGRKIGVNTVAALGFSLGVLYLWFEWAGFVHNTPREHGMVWYGLIGLMAIAAMLTFTCALLMLWNKEYRKHPYDQAHWPFVVAAIFLAIPLTYNTTNFTENTSNWWVVVTHTVSAIFTVLIFAIKTTRGIRMLISIVPSLFFLVTGWYWILLKFITILDVISSGDGAHPIMDQFLSFGYFVLFGAVPLLLSIVWFTAYKPKKPENQESDEGITPLIPINPGDPPYKGSGGKRLSS